MHLRGEGSQNITKNYYVVHFFYYHIEQKQLKKVCFPEKLCVVSRVKDCVCTSAPSNHDIHLNIIQTKSFESAVESTEMMKNNISLSAVVSELWIANCCHIFCCLYELRVLVSCFD